MAQKHAIAAADILPEAEYAKVRVERRRALAARKRQRRVDIAILRGKCRDEAGRIERGFRGSGSDMRPRNESGIA